MNKIIKPNYCLDVNVSYNPPCMFYKKCSNGVGWDFIINFNSEYEAFIYTDINGLTEIKKRRRF